MTLKKFFPVPALQSRAPGLFFALLSLSVPARPADLDALTVPLPPGGAALRLSVFTGPDKTTQASCDCLFHPGDRVEAAPTAAEAHLWIATDPRVDGSTITAALSAALAWNEETARWNRELHNLAAGSGSIPAGLPGAPDAGTVPEPRTLLFAASALASMCFARRQTRARYNA